VARIARRGFREWAVHPLPAYASLLLLQLKVVWGMWWVRDLTSGDTSSYFIDAHRWYLYRGHNLIWSPFYTIYYGSFLYWTSDAYRATIAHRLVLVLIVALLVLALMRRLLEPRIAWLVAAWWVVQPVNHDVLYEVHLFGVIPVLLTCLVLLGPAGPGRRGTALAILLAGAVFVRNELIVPVALLAAASALHEARGSRPAAPAAPPRAARRLLAYGGPALVVILALLGFLATSEYGLARLSSILESKHTLNVCQIYAYGYQQRRSDWQKSPWVECQDLMTRTFGQAQPSMAQAFRANPRAMLEHFGWNVGLIPSSLQVLLFGSTSGTVRVGYEPIEQTILAPILSVVMGLLCLGGALLVARDWSHWWSTWLQPRIWGWLTLAFVSVGCVIIMVTQRPRPAYLFTLELMLQAIAGLCLQAVVRRWRFEKPLASAFPLVMLLVLVAVPSYYAGADRPDQRPLRQLYRALAPYQGLIAARDVVIVTPGYGFELCAYLHSRRDETCKSLNYYELRAEARTSASWWMLLDARGATMFYANEAVTGDPEMRAALAGAEAAGWEVMMRRTTGHGERLLLRKTGAGPARSAGPPGGQPRTQWVDWPTKTARIASASSARRPVAELSATSIHHHQPPLHQA
jgi:hypothetical protein